jgi:hypothetical protein
VPFVVSLNLHRRHLNESQRGMVATKLATLGRGGDHATKAGIPALTGAVPATSQRNWAMTNDTTPRSWERA